MHLVGKSYYKISLSVVFSLLFFQGLNAQGESSSGGVYIIAVLIIIGALILVSAILTLSENLIQIEAQKSGVDASRRQISIIPSIKALWKDPEPEYCYGYPLVDLERGFDIKLNGHPQLNIKTADVKRFAVRPPNFRGLAPIPKVVVEAGHEVAAGDVLFHDKKDDRIKYVAPVSGEVVEVRRGEKRAISDIVILADKKIRYRKLDPPSIKEASREEIVEFMLETGGWALINERPYDVLPDPETIPANIFISTFDTAPLAPNNDFVVQGKGDLFQKGLDVLNRLTGGKVYLGLSANGDGAPSEVFTGAKGVEKQFFKGPHPAGNVGVQIHHTAPIRSGAKVWTLGVQEVITLGELFYKGRYHAERIIAFAGAHVNEPGYIKTFLGANIGDLIDGRLEGDDLRVIAGDVLTGRKVASKDFLDARCDQISVLKEGDYYEMFGWLLPLAPRPSVSRTFPNFMFSDLTFDGDTNSHGEKRAFVVTGQYEKVLPMKMYPQHLIKAIMTGDFEMMEGLGIYELSEEDLALCEFTCTSKMPLQNILREGLDMMREQS